MLIKNISISEICYNGIGYRVMILSEKEKNSIKEKLATCLSNEREVRKVVVFGSFLTKNDPNDVDVAVFQDSAEAYLPLAMKYRRITRSLSDKIPLDIIPLKHAVSTGLFLEEVDKGETVYER